MVTHRVFRALSDPVRRSILRILAHGDRTVSDLAGRFEVSRPAISRHLRLLREAGLVSETRSGRERVHRLESSRLELAASWLLTVAAGDHPAGAAPETTAREAEPASSGAGDSPPADWRQW